GYDCRGNLCYINSTQACTTNGNCGSNNCNGNRCTCTTAAQCAAGYFCQGNECIASNPQGCTAGGQCTSGTCTNNTCTCTTDAQCATNFSCQTGVCREMRSSERVAQLRAANGTNPVTIYTMGMGDASGLNTSELNAMQTAGGSGQTTAAFASNQT